MAIHLRPDQFKVVSKQHGAGAAVSHAVHAELQQAHQALQQQHVKVLTLLAAIASLSPEQTVRLPLGAVRACETVEVRKRIELLQSQTTGELVVRLKPEPRSLIVLP